MLLTRKGTFGIATVVKDKTDYIISSEIFRLELREGINPDYFSIVNNLPIVQKQLQQKAVGTIMGSLSQDALKSVQIPLPPLPIQNRIVALMNKAYSQKKTKESEAQKLLDSINDYVLDELGIRLPELKDKMTYVVNSEEVQGKRIDAYYYQPKFREVEKAINEGKFEVKKLKDNLVVINKLENIESYEYINYVDLASIDKDLGLIRNYNKLNINEAPSRARQKIEKGNLLLSGLSGSLKSIAIFDGSFGNAICSTGFYVIKNSNKYNNYYLWALFRNPLLQMLLQKESSGAIMSAINRDAFLSLKIPLPPLDIQNKIAEEVKKRIQKAEQLQKEGKEELERVKKEVEEIILHE